MKKLICSLGVIVIAGAGAIPIVSNNFDIKNKIKNEDYKTYQNQTDWNQYIESKRSVFNSFVDDIGLNNNWELNTNKNSVSSLSIETQTVDDGKGDKEELAVGTTLMNGQINSVDATPIFATQHIANNELGVSPLTVNYDSYNQQIQTSITNSTESSIALKTPVSYKFCGNGLSTTFDLKTSSAHSETKSSTLNLTFDKFSTTVKQGASEQINYLIMQTQEVINTVFKAKIDTSKSTFNFITKDGSQQKDISWDQISNTPNTSIPFAKVIDDLNKSSGLWDKPFLSMDKINYNNIDHYVFSSMYVYIPLVFSLTQYSTFIQVKPIAK